MPKKAVSKIAGRGSDQYMLRLPAGMREAITKRAMENGRSINTEIVAAIEKYLAGEDRFAAIEAFIESYKEDIEAIPECCQKVETLEAKVSEIQFELRQTSRGPP
jgi:hypothetical protein